MKMQRGIPKAQGGAESQTSSFRSRQHPVTKVKQWLNLPIDQPEEDIIGSISSSEVHGMYFLFVFFF
jgi:hypothetical protein